MKRERKREMPKNQLADADIILLTKTGRTRVLKAGDYWINRNTPVGEPADWYERKPYHGHRLMDHSEILGKMCKGELEIHPCKMTEERWAILCGLQIPFSKRWFHNGQVLTTCDKPFRTYKQAMRQMLAEQRAKRKKAANVKK